MVSAFTGKDAARPYLKYIHVAIEDCDTVLFASDGHIAIEVKVQCILDGLPSSIVPNLKYGIESAPELEAGKIARIREIFKQELKECHFSFFDLMLLNRMVSSIKSFAISCKKRQAGTRFQLCKNYASRLQITLDDVNITALIMPMRGP
jgi:hypothetical protein